MMLQVVAYDATSVRLHAGKHASVLNIIIQGECAWLAWRGLACIEQCDMWHAQQHTVTFAA